MSAKRSNRTKCVSAYAAVSLILVIFAIIHLECIYAMSVDRFALNHNEIQQINDKRLDYNDVIPESESILYDNMQYVPAIDQNGQSDLYVLVPTDNGDDEEIVSNFLGHDHAAIPGNGKVEDMLMLESEDAPTVQIYKLTNKSTENERIIEDHPENHDNSESLKDELTAPKVTELPILNSNEHFEDYKADVLSETVKEIQHELESELLNYEPLNENPQNYQLEALDNANSQAPSLDQTKAEGANTEFIKNDENEDEDKVDQPMIGVAQEEGPTDVSDEIEKTDTMRDNPELAEASSYLNEANTESAIKSEDIPKNSADLVELEKEVQIENRDESLNLNDGENGPVTETLDAQHQDNEAVIEISETSKNIENSLVKDESLENFAEKDTISHLTGMVEEAVQISDNLHSNEKATEPLTDQIESHAVDENEATESQPGGVVMEEEISKETKMNEKMNSATNDSKNVEDDTLTTNKDQFKVEDSKFVVASESKQTENLLQQFDELNAQAIREDNESIFTPEELEDGIEEKLSENDEMQNMPINDEKANANHTMLTVIIQAPQTPTTETPATSFDHDDVVSASDTQDELLAMIAISTSTSKPLHVMDGVLNYANSTFINQQQATESTEVVFGSKLRRYDGAQVWRIVVQNDREKKLADELQTKYGGQLWKEVKQEVDYLLKPQVLADAERHVRIANLTRIVLIDNLQNVIEVENPPAEQIAQLQNRKGHRLTWQAYHRLGDIHDFFDYLAKTYPDICSVEIIGYSLQKRPLKILKISNGRASNPSIWIDGGMHAREWISPAAVTYIANQIVEGWDDLPLHMRDINWYVHPVANPDGYEYSHTTDRLWRKNMRSHGRQCPGVDLNRNFGYKWGGRGTSANPCSQTYRGTKAFSEPEAFYISKFISSFPKETFKAYLSFHCYGQYILYPWGYDYLDTADMADLDLVARQAGTSIAKSSGVKYTVGASANTLYPAAGGSDDWAKGIAEIKYSYTIEMGDTGRYGFILPAHYIESNGKDAYTVVDTITRAITMGKNSRRRRKLKFRSG